MSKKRKTRKQKENAQLRHQHQPHPVISEPVYSVEVKPSKKADDTPRHYEVSKSDKEYLQQDIIKIAAASGIIIAFDILLFVVLSTGAFKLNFLGY